MLWRYEVYFLCLSLHLFHPYFLRSVSSEVQNSNALQISERPKEKATQAPSVFKSSSISENIMCATPRVCVPCRINSCDHCSSLITADGLTWTWIAPSQCLACYWSCSSLPDVLLGWPGTCPIALCVTLSWTPENLLSFQSCGGQLWAHNPCLRVRVENDETEGDASSSSGFSFSSLP